MARLEFDVVSALSGEVILAGLTDMTARRPDIWHGLDRAMYEVYEVGPTWAVIREGNKERIWARERYDWATPGRVTWTMEESSFATPGDFVAVDLQPRDGGGTRLHITWQRRGRNAFGRLIVALNVLTRGALVRGSIRAGSRRMEALAAAV